MAEALPIDSSRLMDACTAWPLRLRLPPWAGPTASTGQSVQRRTALGHERISHWRPGDGHALEAQVVQPSR
jgi:hypothetical protein